MTAPSPAAGPFLNPQPSALDRPIYLDYNATTPVDPAVADLAAEHLRATFGNPSSAHAYGQAAQAAIARARAELADLLGCAPAEVVFTGGGSESDNLAIKGAALAARAEDAGRDHLITGAVEHPAVLNSCRWLVERLGFRLTVLPVDGHGRVDPDDLVRAIEPATALVTIMHANNEVGTLQPIAEIARACRARGVAFHTDAAQSVGKIPIRVDDASGARSGTSGARSGTSGARSGTSGARSGLGVDLLTVAGHKLYAPKGIGALYVRAGRRLDSLVHGAGHEGGRRAGTENTPYIAALGRAAALCQASLPAEVDRLRALRDRLEARLAEAVPGLALNGHPSERLPNTLNVSFPGVDGAELLAATPSVAASTGSACHEGHTDPSPVLVAMGLARDRALGAVRLTLGRWSTEEEVDAAAEALVATWRAMAAVPSPT
ncbi:MAG TPA: cysteine desulfurase family protein [Chloroflexota bacterium]